MKLFVTLNGCNFTPGMNFHFTYSYECLIVFVLVVCLYKPLYHFCN